MKSDEQQLLAELYQILGVLDAPARVLDQVSAAVNGDPLPYDTLLPFIKDQDSMSDYDIDSNPCFIKVEAGVRYWEDMVINGEEVSPNGCHVPFKKGDLWCPVIRIDDGNVVDWPKGVNAQVHFKVCDAGNYFLLNKAGKVIASRMDNYVPDGLCHGSKGYGDYIILNIDAEGMIQNYKNEIDTDEFDFYA